VDKLVHAPFGGQPSRQFYETQCSKHGNCCCHDYGKHESGACQARNYAGYDEYSAADNGAYAYGGCVEELRVGLSPFSERFNHL
jgi:hypothetical protein